MKRGTVYKVSKNYYIITAVSDNMRPSMSKASLHFGSSATSIKIWSRPWRLSFCVLRLVDRDYLYFDVQWCDVNFSRFCFQIFLTFFMKQASLDS